MLGARIPLVSLCVLLVLLVSLQDGSCKRRKGSSSSSLSSVPRSVSSLLGSRPSGRKHAVTRSQGNINSGSGSRTRRPCPSVNITCPTSFASTPPLILIAMDGFRSDYLKRGLTPNLDRLGSVCGVKASHMRPSFPTTTYPNLYTIVTGLYPESHGLIDNEVYDPTLREKLNRDTNWANPTWWQKDPIWVTAEKQGKKTASYFWLGSDVPIHGVRPTHFRVYNPRASWTHRIQTVLDWLDMPPAARPSFITLYFNQPDNHGHRYGPDSSQVNEALRSLDSTIGELINGLDSRRIFGCVNVIIVSDHGMTSKSCSRVIPLDHYVNLTSVYYVTGAASRLRPKGRYNSTTVDNLVNSIRCKTDKLLVAKKEDLPKRFHYSASDRIEPVVLGPTPGWVVRRDNTSNSTNPACTGGTHGYDNMADEMKSLFLAFGPAFKRNVTVAPFGNVELYELMTDLLGITAEPNNGTKGSLHHLLRSPPSLPTQSVDARSTCFAIPSPPTAGRTNTTCLCQANSTAPVVNSSDTALHLPWGSPGCEATLLSNPGSVIGHKQGQGMPTWAAYTLRPGSNSSTGSSNDSGSCWAVDSRLPTAGKCISAEFNLTALTPADSGRRLLSSAAPMHPTFGTGAYGHLVRLIHQWSTNGTVNVVTGPVFDLQGRAPTPHPDLPTHYFVVLTRCATNATQLSNCSSANLSVLSFLLPHQQTRENCLSPRTYLLYHSCRIRDIEYLTGLRFFKSLDPRESARLRTAPPEALWS